VSEVSDPLEAVLRPIVEGQVRSFFNDHPEIARAPAGSYRGQPRAVRDWHGSIVKRIMQDLLCAETRVRLEAALLQGISGKAA